MTKNLDLIYSRLRRLVPVFMFFTCSTQLLAEQGQNNPLEWLERMQNATSNLEYHGVFVYLHDGQLETMRLDHSNEEGVENERLISLNGVPREVIKQGDSILCVLHGNQSVSANHKSAAYLKGFLSVDPQQLVGYYHFTLNGEERIAGRVAQRLLIEPSDNYRYGVNLYLDKEFGLPLKTELLGENGEPISQTMFTQISFEPTSESSEEESDEGREHDQYSWSYEKIEKSAPYDARNSGWSFVDLPKGFEPRLYMRRGEQGAVEHFVLSDGLTTLSVYMELATNADQGLNGPSRIGALNAFGRNANGYQITAVGEVPEQTVKAITQAARKTATGG